MMRDRRGGLRAAAATVTMVMLTAGCGMLPGIGSGGGGSTQSSTDLQADVVKIASEHGGQVVRVRVAADPEVSTSSVSVLQNGTITSYAVPSGDKISDTEGFFPAVSADQFPFDELSAVQAKGVTCAAGNQAQYQAYLTPSGAVMADGLCGENTVVQMLNGTELTSVDDPLSAASIDQVITDATTIMGEGLSSFGINKQDTPAGSYLFEYAPRDVNGADCSLGLVRNAVFEDSPMSGLSTANMGCTGSGQYVTPLDPAKVTGDTINKAIVGAADYLKIGLDQVSVVLVHVEDGKTVVAVNGSEMGQVATVTLD